jgi:PAT family beta-lactamase induction signal transducer AmpG
LLRAVICQPPKSVTPWAWVPTLYLAQGLPYVLVMAVSVILYKDLEVSNADIAFYTSWLYLPWVIKPLWSPAVDLLRTRRLWIWTLQCVLGAAFGAVALTLPGEYFFRWSLAVFWLAAFSSATHDVAADGFYLLALAERQQSFFVGIRSTFYRVANIAGQGALVMLAGWVQEQTGSPRLGWMLALGALGVLLVLAGIYHAFVLPRPAADVARSAAGVGVFLRDCLGTFGSFFRRPRIVPILLFLLLYRLGEAQLVKLAAPFLMDARNAGGLGLSTTQVGFAYGTVGVMALTLGGILGGVLVSRHGLGRWLWPMACLMNFPNLVYVLLARFQPESMVLVVGGIAIEQFGYGFGFTAYLLYMIQIARGPHQTAHYAICTGFMALGMMLPGMVSGWVQDRLGYEWFFVEVVIATLPGFLLLVAVPIEREFGRRGG